MLKLSFSKVIILSVLRKPQIGTLKISCTPTKAVQKAMGWGDAPDWQKSSSPTGKLVTSIVEFTPNHPDLAKQAFELQGAGAVRDFEFVRTQIKKGKSAAKAPSYKTELLCAVDFSDANGARKLEAYMQAVGESTMKVTYEKAAEQEELALDEDRKQATLEEND